MAIRWHVFYLPHGRLYWLALRGNLALFGTNLAAARALSVAGWLLAGAATAFVALRYSGSRRVAGWAAALVLTTWLCLYAGHNTRPDMLAAAAVTAVVGLVHVVLTRQSRWPVFLLGLLLALQLDFHLNLLHFTWPLVVVVGWRFVQKRQYVLFIPLLAGMLLGGVIYVLLHLGGELGDVLHLMVNNPSSFLESYVNPRSDRTLYTTLVVALHSFGQFWFQYYAWFAPWASLPLALTYLTGLITSFFNHQGEVRMLGLVVLLSSLSFAVVNADYQALYYAVLWIPLYSILAAAGVFWLVQQIPGGPTHNWRQVTGTGVLATLLVINVAGSLHLGLANSPSDYVAAVESLSQHFEPGDSVLSSSEWWYGLHDKAVFLDEYLLAAENTSVWWNAVPSSPQDVAGGLSLVDTTTKDGGNAAALVERRISRELRPDFIIDDGRLGCVSDPIPLSQELTDFTEQHCTHVDAVTTDRYGTNFVYHCEW